MSGYVHWIQRHQVAVDQTSLCGFGMINNVSTMSQMSYVIGSNGFRVWARCMKQSAYHGVQQARIRWAFVFSLLGIPELDLHFQTKRVCAQGTFTATMALWALCDALSPSCYSCANILQVLWSVRPINHHANRTLLSWLHSKSDNSGIEDWVALPSICVFQR